MTRFSDELRLIADQASDGPADLAEKALRGNRRQRKRTFTLASVTAALLALTLTGAVVMGGSQGGGTISGKVTDVLPASGVGAASHAYHNFCGRQWNPGRNTAALGDRTCAQWRLVTRTGQSFRVPEAVSVYSEQSAENYMNTSGPLEISSDGRRIAYYSGKDQRFAVRDLSSGRIWLSPQTVTRAAMVKSGGLLQISPDGRFLGMSGAGRPSAVLEVETGKMTEVPQGWQVRRVPNGGAPVVVMKDRQLGLLTDGQVKALTTDANVLNVSELSPDGHTLAYMDSGTVRSGMGKLNLTLHTIYLPSGKTSGKIELREAPKRFLPMRIGGWLSPTEVIVADQARGAWGGSGPESVPTLGDITYGVDVISGRVRMLAKYTYRAWAGDMSIPGF
ncbi:hypothetical protein ACQP2T_19915 [Nonomuraea sp. CA-143628]|uniref:hypothetical protein n=1 Tax=Nonomuraea sp. CA-143628 TaxID=3239997 RepID=UPI003D936036